MRKIGIFGRRGDLHVSALAEAIEKAGAKPQVIDFKSFPKLNQCSHGLPIAPSFDDIREPTPFPLDDLDAAIVRGVHSHDLSCKQVECWSNGEVASHHRRQIAKVSFQLALHLVLAERIPVINPPHAHLFHRQKGRQHQRLLKNGIPTPSAIVTNNRKKALEFTGRLQGRVVVKPQASGAEVVMADDGFFRENNPLDRPYIFQQYVKGTALRVYALGGDVILASEIKYDKKHVDWRERVESIKPHSLSEELSKQVREAARLLDLPFCGIDIEYDEYSNKFYFLDFNPSAYFLFASKKMGVDIALSIAQYALRVARDGRGFW